MRVSTAGMNGQMISQSLQAQSRYAEALEQESSGLKSSALSGLGGQAGAAISLKSDIAKSENLVSQAETASSQLQIAYSAVDSMADTVTKALTSIASGLDGDTTDASTLQSEASGWLSDIASLLNTQYADSYVFSGGATTTAPVDITSGYGPTSGSSTDTSYYQGGSTPVSLMVDSDHSISYGVTADADAFEQTLRGLSILSGIDTSDGADNTALLQEAYDLLSTATSGLGAIQEKLSSQTNSLDDLADNQTEFQLYANETLDSLTTVDAGTASAEVSQQEVLLQASFAALSSLKSVSVLDYL